ncbi:FMN-dependent NADH-azoreductase [Niveibacterium terrae]|uniref:FMN-dependent NADH-azoreductase n=1 Tax=Niveibacterium terrae TaxID=3373598 RepID=UPI003A8D2408
MNILQINSSARSEGAQSTAVAERIVARLKAGNPQASLKVRDLASDPHPALDQAALGALFTPAESRSPEQAARVALDDANIAEIQAADAIVLGVPMYNFGITSQLKNWIDSICRAKVTFQYTENGPEGLLKGKKVYVAFARGGKYRGSEADTQVPYLKAVLGFLGMTDVQFVFAEGLAMGPEAAAAAHADADAQIAALAL